MNFPISRSGWPLAMLVAGGLQAASLAWPGSGQPLWWLQLLSLALLCAGLRGALTSRQAAWRGGLFALTWMIGSFWWLFISMHTYGGLPAPLAVLAVFGLAAFLAAYYALAAWGWWRLGARGPWRAALGFAALWTLAELARGTLWTGFPWGAGGYAHVDGPLAVWPRWLGVYGTGALAAWLAMWAVQKPARSWLRAQSAIGVLVAIGVWLGAGWLQRQSQEQGLHAPLSVALLQGNIPQDEKFIPGAGIELALHWYGQQLLNSKASLVVAPETAIPLLPQQLPAEYLEAVRAPFVAGQQAALIGIPLGDDVQGYTNSVQGWLPGASGTYRYDKHHLVPFGEFIPPLFHWFVQMMNIPLGDFNRGAVGQAAMDWQGERLGPNICYEDLFGEELGGRFAEPGSAPTIFVNLSNIGWFGDSLAIDQHLQISRMRALEFERPMLRATNTGATAVIDHRGVVTASLPRMTRGVLEAWVQGRDGLTPFARWVSAVGLWPLWLLCLGVCGWLWRGRSAGQTVAR